MKTINRKVLFFSLGAGCYWSSSLLATISWKDSHSVTADAAYQVMPLLVILAVVIAACACSRQFHKRSFQVGLALIGVAAFAVKAAIFLIDGLAYPPLYLCFLVAEGCQTASFILFWGLGFASLDKSAAEKTVFLSLMFCFMLYLALSLLPASPLAVLLVSALKVIGVAPFLMSSQRYTVTPRTPDRRNYRLFVPVVASRVFFGAASGIAMALLTFRTGADIPASPIACGALLAVLTATFLVLIRSKAPSAGLLRVSPLLIAGALVAPYLGSGRELEVLLHSTFMVVWLSWIVLSSIQMSDLKEKVGWDEARLAFCEKAVYVAAWVASWAFAYVIATLLDEPVLGQVEIYALPAITYLTIIVSCVLLSGLVDGKIWTSTMGRASELIERQAELVHERVAEHYQLTNQERNVMALIAEGHKRPYICEKLVLAESTVKSHTKHLYQKLDIHSREELLEVIERQRESLASPKGWDWDDRETAG